jgi:hypothetical protein
MQQVIHLTVLLRQKIWGSYGSDYKAICHLECDMLHTINGMTHDSFG